MIVNSLKQRVESYAERLDRENRLLALARQGKVTAEMTVAYLSGVLFLIRKTQGHLSLAVRRSHQVGRPDLGAFFEHKLIEESGHDQWALQDFEELRRLFGRASVQPPDANVVALADFLEEQIDRAPASYLAYIFLAEYMTVLVGPAWLAALEEHCGIPRGALTVVSKHVDLDRDHVAEALRELEGLLIESDAPELETVLSRSMARYDAFYEAVADLEAHAGDSRATA